MIEDRQDRVESFMKEIKNMMDANKKNIVFTLPNLIYSGGVSNIIQTAHILSDQGHNVTLAIEDHLIDQEVLDLCGKLPVVMAPFAPKCDLLVVHSTSHIADKFVLSKKAKKKALFQLGYIFESEKKNIDLPWDIILTTSDKLTYLVKNHNQKKNVYQVGWYHFSHPQFFTEKEFTIPPKIGFVYSLAPNKNSKFLVEALKNVENVSVIGLFKYNLPDTFDIKLKLPRWQFIDVIKSLDVLVDASINEGIGRLYLEAMSARTLVVAKEGASEILKNRENCLTYQSKSELLTILSHLKKEEIQSIIQTAALQARSYYHDKYIDYIFRWTKLLDII